MSLKVDIVEDIEAHREDLVALLETLVEKRTTPGTEGPGQQVIADTFEDMGLTPDVWTPDVNALRDHEGFFETTAYKDYGYDDRPNVVAKIDGSGDGPSLALSGHMDVVTVSESEWKRDPWTVTRNGDTLYGRGVADMKGGLVANIMAVQALLRNDITLKGDLILQSTIEEEAGGIGGVLSALERGYQPDAAIISEPLGIPNIGIASAGLLYFSVAVPGNSAHAAWGYRGVSAIEKAMQIVDGLTTLDTERKATIEYEPAYRANPDLEGYVTNLNVGTFNSGVWPSTVPGSAELQCRIGWPPGETVTDVQDQIESAINAVVAEDDWLSANPPEIDWFGWKANPHESDLNADIARIGKQNAETITGESGSYIGGNVALDERLYKLYYDIDSISMGPSEENIHGADERTTLTSLVETAQSIALTAVAYCGVKR